ncbi:MAG: protein-L-isoaspartate O-methyltransferase [Candidatus Bathyarchaeia archaeon]
MPGWIVPPPKKPVKSEEDFIRERMEKVKWLAEQGFLRSRRIASAMLKVSRELFIPEKYRDYAYLEVPLPLPGRNATISCPHSYPLFYEALELKAGERFLEVGSGSGYGAALAREIIGEGGKVVTLEIDEETYEFARANLERTGYGDVLIFLGDGSLGCPSHGPYDKVCVTASCPRIPDPLIYQLDLGGRLIAPVGSPRSTQDLVLLEKKRDGTWETKPIDKVLYVPLRGKYGWNKSSTGHAP